MYKIGLPREFRYQQTVGHKPLVIASERVPNMQMVFLFHTVGAICISGAFAKLPKVTVTVSCLWVCMPAFLSEWNKSAPNGRIITKFGS
jgi:hypothetical protein